MGTNYFWRSTPCRLCGGTRTELHIGKHSVGWEFSLHVHPDLNIRDLDDWRRTFNEPGSEIRDEYDRRVSVSRMLQLITDLPGVQRQVTFFTPEFLERNQAEVGPRNLLRHPLSDRCIGRGDGTYSLFVGDFS